MAIYYGKGTKEKILANLGTEIGTVTGINFVDYQRMYNSGITKEKYPGVFINDVRTDKERILKDIVKNIFNVGFVGFVWVDEGEDLSTALNAFMESVKDKIMLDNTRDSNAYDTRIVVVETDAGSRFPQGVFLILLEILFFSSE